MSRGHRRFALMQGWTTIFQALGLDTRAVLRDARLPADLLAQRDVRLPAEDYFRLWTTLEQMLGRADFMLPIFQDFPTEAFDPPVFAAFCSPDLATAVGRIARFKPLLGPLALEITRPEGDLAISVAHTPELEDDAQIAGPMPASLAVAELAFYVYLARRGARREVVPLAATAPCARTPGDVEALTAYMGCRVDAGDEVSLRFAAEDAERPFLTSNASMWQFFEPALQARLASLGDAETTAERVHSALLELLPSGLSSADDVAKRLAVSKRTLQRRLNHEGTSYQALLGRVRARLATHYLTKSNVSSAEIAYLLGFNEPSSFHRAFRDWTGRTPEAIRTESRSSRTH